MSTSTIRSFMDIVIPTYNTPVEKLVNAIASSVLTLGLSKLADLSDRSKIIVVDDGSTIDSVEVAKLAIQTPQFVQNIYAAVEKSGGVFNSEEAKVEFGKVIQQIIARVKFLKNAENMGAAFARNVGALYSQANYIAFLDADDEYEINALDLACEYLSDNKNVGMVRLDIKPIDFPEDLMPSEKKTKEENQRLNLLWKTASMTVAGNIVIHRSIFLASGGFPTDEMFKRIGGEDGAFQIGASYATRIHTFFNHEKQDYTNNQMLFASVCHKYHENSHVAKMLREGLGLSAPQVTQKEYEAANFASQTIYYNFKAMSEKLNIQTNDDGWQNNIADLKITPQEESNQEQQKEDSLTTEQENSEKPK